MAEHFKIPQNINADDEKLHDFLVKNNLRWLDRMIFKDLFDDEE